MPTGTPGWTGSKPVPGLSTEQLAAESGLTMRQLDFAHRRGWISPSLVVGKGSGSRRRWGPEQVALCQRVKRRMDWGLEAWAAWREVDPGPVPE